MRRIAVLLVLATPACTVGVGTPAGAAGGGAADVDAGVADGRVMDMLDTQILDEARRARGFTQINQAPYASTLGAFNITVSVNQDARDYRQIHPESSGSHVTMPVGTLLVREVLDAAGQVTKVTLMAKAPAGYDPTIGDWWWGVTDPSGAPLSDASGLQVGRLTACHGCHLPRATDDYLFGVPQAAR
ncbi:MAG TPA: hypothetical protein VFT22_31670 [Kofleriaceae bacterium]|nr:hypothetical protein [Kofleriaceae bacterium]